MPQNQSEVRHTRKKNSAALTEDGAIRSISDFLKCVRRAVIRLKRFQPTSGLRSS
jgi:hypothetical protein